MLDAVLPGLDVPEEHRAVGLDAHVVRQTMDGQPTFATDLFRAESGAHGGGKDLAPPPVRTCKPAARNSEHGPLVAIPGIGEMGDLHRREGLDHGLGAGFRHRATRSR